MPIVSLSTWSLLFRGDCLTAMRFAAAHGFGGVEIWSSPLDLPPWASGAGELAAIRSLARQHGLTLAVHFAYGSNHLADLNQGHRRESLRQLDETIRACREIGAGMLILHSGTLPPELPRHEEAGYDPRVSTTMLRTASPSAGW